MLRFALLGLAVLYVGGLAPASAAERTHDVVPADYFTLATITDIALSPDGSTVAYAEARWDEADGLRKSNLWLVATDGKSPPLRLTGDRANERSPRWAADGSAVYVLGNRKRAGEDKPPYNGSTQVWRVPLSGEPFPVTRVDGGVGGYDYAPEAETLFYSVDTMARDKDDFADLRKKFTKPDYGTGVRTVSEVHRLNLATWRADKVIDESRYVRELAITRDGHRLAMITAIDDTVVQSEGHSRVDVWDDSFKPSLSTINKDWRKKAASPWPWLTSLAWSDDGRDLAFCAVYDAHPADIIMCRPNALLGGSPRSMRSSIQDGWHVHGYGSPLKYYPGPPVGLGDPDVYPGWIAEREGRTKTTAFFGRTGDGVLDWQVVHPDARADFDGVVLKANADDFPDIYRVEHVNLDDAPPDLNPFEQLSLPQKLTRLTNVNPHTETWQLPLVKHITWKTPDGASVGGVLELPPDDRDASSAKGRPYPLIVAMHGGPTTSTKADLSFDPHNGRLYTSAAGYAVLCPNYRGSTGYGDKFVTDLIGNENDVEVKDILAGIQHLVDAGIADPNRIGVMGWSNGGYLTNCLITLKDSPFKFRAASSGAGILDTVAEWGFNDEPAYPMVFKKGAPWETPDIYRKTSPTYGLGNVTTPTLIHVGGNDVRCPPGHSRMLHRALKHYVKVPTELVVYPGEPHGLTKMANRRAKMEWDLAWFDKYLKTAE